MRFLKLAAVAFAAGVSIAQAQAAQDDLTGTGGGPASAAKAPYTASTGATVPRPGVLDRTREEDAGRAARRRAEDEKSNKAIDGICIGCGPK